jgi:hypothetical protein
MVPRPYVRLAPARDHAISQAHASVISVHKDEGIFLACLHRDGCDGDDVELL